MQMRHERAVAESPRINGFIAAAAEITCHTRKQLDINCEFCHFERLNKNELEDHRDNFTGA